MQLSSHPAPDLLSLLVCPTCGASLRIVDKEAGLACDACSVVFPVDQGIPVLLAEHAVPRAEWERGERRPKP